MTSIDIAKTPSIDGAQGPPKDEIGHKRVMVVIGALLLGMLIAALDQTIVSTALPKIAGDLHGASHYAWVVTAYLLSSTITTPMWGKLGDQYGRKIFYQAAIIIFLIGSALSGLSHSMTELIIFRFVQGLGGGGLMVGAQTILGDVVSPRDRGRYMGLFMAVFGITTVVGPLIGGVIEDSIGWRWIFYINLPVGGLALIVSAFAIPKVTEIRKQIIDYAGFFALALAASAFVLVTSLGGTSFAWASPLILSLGAVGIVLTAAFLILETKAKDPVMRLALFRSKIFNTATGVGFVTGFAMFGALTFLPLFLQVVDGVSPIMSGVRLFPMMLGVLITSIGSGQLVARWGKYKIFVTTGTVLMVVGFLLMTRLGPTSGAFITSLYMFILGSGLGLVMAIPLVVIQNAVKYEELGAATSNSSFFRLIGACFGTAAFGAAFSNLLPGNLRKALPNVPIPRSIKATLSNPTSVKKLSPVLHHGVVIAISNTVDKVFFIGAPVAALAVLLAWLIPEIPLRKSVGPTEAGDLLSATPPRTSIEEMELAIARLEQKENRVELYEDLAQRAEVKLTARAAWMLFRIGDNHSQDEAGFFSSLEKLKVPQEMITISLKALFDADMVTTEPVSNTGLPNEHHVTQLTEVGHEALQKLLEARRLRLSEMLQGWDIDENPELENLIKRLAGQLMADDHPLIEAARSRIKVSA